MFWWVYTLGKPVQFHVFPYPSIFFAFGQPGDPHIPRLFFLSTRSHINGIAHRFSLFMSFWITCALSNLWSKQLAWLSLVRGSILHNY
jgi:hypothetical protein